MTGTLIAPVIPSSAAARTALAPAAALTLSLTFPPLLPPRFPATCCTGSPTSTSPPLDRTSPSCFAPGPADPDRRSSCGHPPHPSSFTLPPLLRPYPLSLLTSLLLPPVLLTAPLLTPYLLLTLFSIIPLLSHPFPSLRETDTITPHSHLPPPSPISLILPPTSPPPPLPLPPPGQRRLPPGIRLVLDPGHRPVGQPPHQRAHPIGDPPARPARPGQRRAPAGLPRRAQRRRALRTASKHSQTAPRPPALPPLSQTMTNCWARRALTCGVTELAGKAVTRYLGGQ